MEILKFATFLIAPAIAILISLYLKYRFPEGKFGLLYKSFIYGLISLVPVLVVQLIASSMGLDSLTTLKRIAFYSLVVMGMASEISKFVLLKIFIYPKEDFKTPVDGIIYSVMIAMGFATVNNILYFINIPNLTVSTLNAATAGPANLIYGVLMGFFVGLGKMREIKFIDSLTGLAAAIFFHAMYDFCLITKDHTLLGIFFAGSLIITFSLIVVAIRMDQKPVKRRRKY
jgi:RsiW-degrading membrane proteinase PrsW (M82 family)